MSVQNHFWAGSLCNIFYGNKSLFPKRVIGASDIIRLITDINNGKSESFQLQENNVRHPSIKIQKLEFEGSMHFTGIEWWNKIGIHPYPIRYHAEISLLRYAQGDSLNGDKITFLPYNSVISDIDKQGKQYPISFQNPKVMDGCICYNVSSGTSK